MIPGAEPRTIGIRPHARRFIATAQRGWRLGFHDITTGGTSVGRGAGTQVTTPFPTSFACMPPVQWAKPGSTGGGNATVLELDWAEAMAGASILAPITPASASHCRERFRLMA